MLIRVYSPTRIDLAGGFTDVEPYASEQTGAVTNFAINLFSTVRLKESSSVVIKSHDFGKELRAERINELRPEGCFALIIGAIKQQQPESGIFVETRCSAPPSSGLGTSASLTVALLSGLKILKGESFEPASVAEDAHRVEIEQGIAGGRQDQYAAAFGGANLLRFGRDGVKMEAIKLSNSLKREIEERSVLVYTGKSRLSGNMIVEVMNRYREGNEKTVRALHTMKGVALEIRDSIRSGRIEEIGSLIHKNWLCQKKLYNGISTQHMEKFFTTAMKNGAIGGKACGAGGGGCLFFIAKEGKREKLENSLREIGGDILKFRISMEGVRVRKETS